MEIKGDKGVRGVTSPTGLGVKANSMVDGFISRSYRLTSEAK